LESESLHYGSELPSLHIFLVNILLKKSLLVVILGKNYIELIYIYLFIVFKNKKKYVTTILETRHQETPHPRRARRRCRFLCPLTLPPPPLPPGLDMQVLGVKGRD